MKQTRAAESRTTQPAPEFEDRLVPFQESLRRLRRSRASGYRLIAEGKLKTVRIGKNRFIAESEIRRIVEEGTER